MEYVNLLEINKVEIGVSKFNNWVFKVGNHIYEHLNNTQNNFILWLPILETPYSTFSRSIDNSLDQLSITKEKKETLINSFPVNRILETALNSNSEYWITFAFNWLSEIKYSKCFLRELDEIIKNKRYSQKLRHKAQKLKTR